MTTDKHESIVASINTKIVMKLEDPEKTYNLFVKSVEENNHKSNTNTINNVDNFDNKKL